MGHIHNDSVAIIAAQLYAARYGSGLYQTPEGLERLTKECFVAAEIFQKEVDRRNQEFQRGGEQHE